MNHKFKSVWSGVVNNFTNSPVSSTVVRPTNPVTMYYSPYLDPSRLRNKTIVSIFNQFNKTPLDKEAINQMPKCPAVPRTLRSLLAVQSRIVSQQLTKTCMNLNSNLCPWSTRDSFAAIGVRLSFGNY
uniref:Smp_203020 n=2 Tax=Schistosoma mansoni TaxID=6183 RepID=A0A3Q0KV33_SCHMA